MQNPHGDVKWHLERRDVTCKLISVLCCLGWWLILRLLLSQVQGLVHISCESVLLFKITLLPGVW